MCIILTVAWPLGPIPWPWPGLRLAVQKEHNIEASGMTCPETSIGEQAASYCTISSHIGSSSSSNFPLGLPPLKKTSYNKLSPYSPYSLYHHIQVLAIFQLFWLFGQANGKITIKFRIAQCPKKIKFVCHFMSPHCVCLWRWMKLQLLDSVWPKPNVGGTGWLTIPHLVKIGLWRVLMHDLKHSTFPTPSSISRSSMSTCCIPRLKMGGKNKMTNNITTTSPWIPGTNLYNMPWMPGTTWYLYRTCPGCQGQQALDSRDNIYITCPGCQGQWIPGTTSQPNARDKTPNQRFTVRQILAARVQQQTNWTSYLWTWPHFQWAIMQDLTWGCHCAAASCWLLAMLWSSRP